MIQGLDHLVIACADPDAAAEQLESAMGIASTGGGRHERFGTRNRIAWLADGSYLELIGIEDAALLSASPVGQAAARVLERTDAGLATYALAVTGLEGMVEELRRSGAGIGPAEHGSRRRPDGELVEWRAAFPDSDLAADAVPFLIEHVYAGAEWGPDALAARRRFAHPIGGPVALEEHVLVVEDPAALAMDLSNTLGLATRRLEDGFAVTVGGHRLRLVDTAADRTLPTVILTAALAAPRKAELLGLRFEVKAAPTSGTG